MRGWCLHCATSGPADSHPMMLYPIAGPCWQSSAKARNALGGPPSAVMSPEYTYLQAPRRVTRRPRKAETASAQCKDRTSANGVIDLQRKTRLVGLENPPCKLSYSSDFPFRKFSQRLRVHPGISIVHE